MRTTIPVIDIFAGPGGLGEGFCSYRPEGRVNRAWRILLSVETDIWAHRTLELRSFFRQFSRDAPEAYYCYIRGEITRQELYQQYPTQASQARNEAMRAELGRDDAVIYNRIAHRLQALPDRNWLLVGGPPCQAYSVIGRSRRREFSETDSRQVLYQEYLRILARFQPAAFVMENVKGMLSSQVRLDATGKPHTDGNQERIFHRILRDIKRPVQAVREVEPDWNEALPANDVTYRIYSLVVPCNDPEQMLPESFIIRSEEYGVPQLRHRVILLGVRGDLNEVPGVILPHTAGRVPIEIVIGDLPRLRSQLSKRLGQVPDSPEAWLTAIRGVLGEAWLKNPVGTPTPHQLSLFDHEGSRERGERLRLAICAKVANIPDGMDTGSEYIACNDASPRYRADWYCDPRVRGVCNHTGRSHMASDLHRYMFLACYADLFNASPTMWQFPQALRPQHRNVQDWDSTNPDQPFDDRFRVQARGRPATTITSHIAKDGHYYVHYDATQCRSLTVREAARIQTFPDNYFFEGPRTQQYRQVGNAVPPLLARQIAAVVYDLFERINQANR